MHVGQCPFLDRGDVNLLVRGSIAEASMIFRPKTTWCALLATYAPSDAAVMVMLSVLAALSSLHAANSNFIIHM